jgi:predicted  nucleic acid-binding Zn-ribbon protein
MHRFRFKNIWLLSHQEHKARHVKFHPSKNLLVGRNHTGKTTLIRSLFETLGATPQGKLEKWDENAVSLLEFSVDDKRYFALHQYGRRALFDATLNLLISTTKFGEWSKRFCEITDFNLVFSDKKQAEVVPADPACFFAPFYVNQDGSWQAEWNTFGGMKRFNAPFKPILEYFTGVCPPAYYAANAAKSQHAKTLEEHRREYKLLERTIERFSKSVPLTGPKVNADNFATQIEQLTKEVNELNIRQEGLRSIVVREQELEKSLDHQIHLADGALAAYDSDAKYLFKEGAAPLICPTCHAEHDKPFLDLLEFAEDARVLRELAARLREDAAEVRMRTRKAFFELHSLNENYLRISRLLDSRKGELKFKDVVGSLGAESAFAAFEEERKQIQASIDAVVLTIDALETKMNELRSLKRTKAILADFREHYAASRIALQLHPVPTKNIQLASRPSLSGSGGPRSILAYYAAIWRTVQGRSGTYDVPVVIDSPNQQAQDDLNLPAVLSFIAENLPSGMQLIVGLETPTNFSFDREVTLTERYGMLIERDWETTLALMTPLLNKMYDATLAQSQS